MNEKLRQKSYLGFVLSIEETILSIDEIENKLREHCETLGNGKDFEVPQKRTAESKGSSSVGWIVGFIVAAIVAVIKVVSGVMSNKSHGLSELVSVFGEFMLGMLVGALAGAVVGVIINMIIKSKNDNEAQKKADAEYEFDLEQYKIAETEDRKRVEAENTQKAYILHQIDLLNNKRKKSEGLVDKLYNYNIINNKYWHNLPALSYFNQYYIHPLEQSSLEDARLAYKKAYSDYERDRNFGAIVVNPRSIMSASDETIRKQRDLYRMMKELYITANKVVEQIINESNNHNVSQEDSAVCVYIEEKEEIERLCTLILSSIK